MYVLKKKFSKPQGKMDTPTKNNILQICRFKIRIIKKSTLLILSFSRRHVL